MRIAIDIDSTLHHYWGQLREVALRRYGVDLSYEEQRSWAIDGLRRDQLAACVRETHSERLVSAAVPYPGAVEAIAAWHADGHFIHVTSHRSADAHAATARWLERIGLPHDELYCSYDKITRCRELEIDVLVDDSPVNLAHAAEAGIRPATLMHPWNAELCRGDPAVVCGRDWPELARRLAPVLAGQPAATAGRADRSRE